MNFLSQATDQQVAKNATSLVSTLLFNDVSH